MLRVDIRAAQWLRRRRRPFLRIRNLVKRFGAFTALEGRFARRDAGRVRLLPRAVRLRQDHAAARDRGPRSAGRRHASRSPAATSRACRRPQRDFGIVFQSYALFPNLTVAANVGYGLVNRRSGRRRSRHACRRTARRWSACPSRQPNIRCSCPAASSSASRWRARSRRRPALLLLDEPLSALDARVRLRLRDEIKALQRRLGVTTIMVTHDQEEALADGRPHRGDEPGRDRAGRLAVRYLPRTRRRPSSPISSAA